MKKVLRLPKKNNKKENDKRLVKFARVSFSIKRTDIYFIQVDVPVSENKKENTEAYKLAWDAINCKEIDSEKYRIGDGFETTILKKEDVEYIPEEIK